MSKQKSSSRLSLKSTKLALLASSLLVLVGGVVLPRVQADQFTDQINALEQQNTQKRGSVASLQERASSYQDAIDKLQAQINAIQQAIDANRAKNAELQQQITETEIELAKQRKLLGENIKAMYIEGQITTLEMLASSKDLSEFVDKQQYRNAVKDKIKSTLDKVTKLKLELKAQKEEVERLLREQESLQAQVSAQQAEQTRLLNLNQGEQSAYNQQIKDNQTKISDLRRQQAIVNASLFGGGAIIQTSRCDIYPQNWCNAPIDSIVDSWGMYNRECVSWTAYRVAASGRYMPYWGGYGNANQWDDNARAAGIPVDGNPQVGDVAISNKGFYGHSMYVEAVFDDGTIAVSQFNHDWGGTYSFVPKMNKGSLVFIHF